MPELLPLHEPDWPQLHRLMQARGFPDVPTSYRQAKPHFKAAQIWGLWGPEGLQAGFIFGPPQDGIAFFDAICTTAASGRWATRPVLSRLFVAAFAAAPKGLGLRALWVQPHGARALKACLTAGFWPVTPLRRRGEPPVLVITPRQVPKIYHKGELNHGKPL